MLSQCCLPTHSRITRIGFCHQTYNGHRLPASLCVGCVPSPARVLPRRAWSRAATALPGRPTPTNSTRSSLGSGDANIHIITLLLDRSGNTNGTKRTDGADPHRTWTATRGRIRHMRGPRLAVRLTCWMHQHSLTVTTLLAQSNSATSTWTCIAHWHSHWHALQHGLHQRRLANQSPLTWLSRPTQPSLDSGVPLTMLIFTCGTTTTGHA